ncbi:unnamed protein product [Trifolium pratense]|uniref:Uncharacterized protein n=1 Tax=Trifolium pratense TaxID=57577 RepID=A0ACB0MBV1_TRIPR|nr:unnamed protein product [Trifolium pratense]
MLNMKIQDLEIVEELRIKRADKHEIVKYEDLETAISSANVVQVCGFVNITLVIIVLIVDLPLDVCVNCTLGYVNYLSWLRCTLAN